MMVSLLLTAQFYVSDSPAWVFCCLPITAG